MAGERIMPPKCGTCDYFNRDLSKCFIDPPVVCDVQKIDGETVVVQGRPGVGPDNYCGRHKPRAYAPELAEAPKQVCTFLNEPPYDAFGKPIIGKANKQIRGEDSGRAGTD